MNLKKGDKLMCIYTINNIMDMPLFEEGKTYEILDIQDDEVCLNHNLYANEYGYFYIDFVQRNFKTLKEIRKKKLNKINKKNE